MCFDEVMQHSSSGAGMEDRRDVMLLSAAVARFQSPET